MSFFGCNWIFRKTNSFHRWFLLWYKRHNTLCLILRSLAFYRARKNFKENFRHIRKRHKLVTNDSKLRRDYFANVPEGSVLWQIFVVQVSFFLAHACWNVSIFDNVFFSTAVLMNIVALNKTYELIMCFYYTSFRLIVTPKCTEVSKSDVDEVFITCVD